MVGGGLYLQGLATVESATTANIIHTATIIARRTHIFSPFLSRLPHSSLLSCPSDSHQVSANNSLLPGFFFPTVPLLLLAATLAGPACVHPPPDRSHWQSPRVAVRSAPHRHREFPAGVRGSAPPP